jgi:alpha-1,3-mannosyltransferase/beta-1,4-glucosyltransferase
LQEAFIAEASLVMPQTAFIGVGALIDFLAGSTPRAPAWMRALKLEWCFRLMCEPRRMWRRYTVEVVLVAAALLGARAQAMLTAKAT